MKILALIIGLTCFGFWCKNTDNGIGVAIRNEVATFFGWGGAPTPPIPPASFEELEIERKIQAIDSKIRGLASDARSAAHAGRGSFVGSDHMFYQRSVDRLELERSSLERRYGELKSARMGSAYLHRPSTHTIVESPTTGYGSPGINYGDPSRPVSRVNGSPVIYNPQTGRAVTTR